MPICPCINSTSRLQIESPSPVPPYLRAVELSACEKAWNIFGLGFRGEADSGINDFEA